MGELGALFEEKVSGATPTGSVEGAEAVLPTLSCVVRRAVLLLRVEESLYTRHKG